MVGKTAPKAPGTSKSSGTPDPSKMTDKAPEPNTSPSTPQIPPGPRMMQRAGAMLEKGAPTDRPTVEKIPRRPKPAPGGGHSKDEPQEAEAPMPNKNRSVPGKGGLLVEKGEAELRGKTKGPSLDDRTSKLKQPHLRETRPGRMSDMPRRP